MKTVRALFAKLGPLRPLLHHRTLLFDAKEGEPVNVCPMAHGMRWVQETFSGPSDLPQVPRFRPSFFFLGRHKWAPNDVSRGVSRHRA